MLHKKYGKRFSKTVAPGLWGYYDCSKESIISDVQETLKKRLYFFYSMGKPRIPHLLCCQGFGVVYYSLTLGRLGSPASGALTLGFV